MKNNNDISPIISAIVGGGFFAIPYLALSVPLLPSVGMAVVAFGATSLILSDSNKNPNAMNVKIDGKPDLAGNGLIIYEAKKQNNQIKEITKLLEDPDLIKDILEINSTVTKIIDVVSKKPEKMESLTTFFNYYLPVTLKILQRYDDIENQRMDTKDSKEIMRSTRVMIDKINISFKNQLSALFQAEIMDTDAELKVFETMLKQDGHTNTDFKI